MPNRPRTKDGIFDRGDGWLYLQYKGRRPSLRTKDPATARARAREERNRIDDPAHGAARLTTLSVACEEFRQYAATGENRRKPPSPATFQMYENHFANLCRVLGFETPLDRVDATAVDRYIAARRGEHIGKAPPAGEPDARRTVSANTVDKELGTLRQILTLGLRRGWYHLPLEKVLPRSSGAEYVPLKRFLTLEQVPLLLDALAASTLSDDPEGRAAYCAYIVAFAADVVAAERAERHDLGDELHADLLPLIRGTKNAKRWDNVPVIYPFGPFADRAREYLVKHGAFPKWGKQRCRDLAKACLRAGLPRVTPRDLRRTHGKILAALGVSSDRIGEMMRHADNRMAQRIYAVPERLDVRTHAARATRDAGAGR